MTKVNKNRVIWCDAGWMPYHYGFCPNETAWHHSFGHLKMDREPYPQHKACTSLFLRKDTKRRCALVTVGSFAPIVTADLLVHEAMHVWRDMRETIGEKEPSSEFEAYALQNIAANLFTAYEATRGRLFVRRVTRPQP